MGKFSFAIALGLAAAIIGQAGHAGQASGTRIKDKGADTQPVTILRFDEAGEFAAARALISRGESDKAIATIQALMKRDKTPSIQYAAWNALCAAYSADKNVAAARQACDKAVALRPSHWMALNSRGTLHLITGSPEAALDDYERAKDLAPNTGAADVVAHNIALAKARLDG